MDDNLLDKDGKPIELIAKANAINRATITSKMVRL